MLQKLWIVCVKLFLVTKLNIKYIHNYSFSHQNQDWISILQLFLINCHKVYSGTFHTLRNDSILGPDSAVISGTVRQFQNTCQRYLVLRNCWASQLIKWWMKRYYLYYLLIILKIWILKNLFFSSFCIMYLEFTINVSNQCWK